MHARIRTVVTLGSAAALVMALGFGASAAGSDAQNYLDTIARSADNASWLLPEQVWDHQPPAGTGPDFQPGEPTFSATPLAWTHAQFIRLAWSIDNGAPVETPQPVACRYSSPICGR
ncbi:MAG TPA: hypothetical protein VGA04_28325 [Streptosporangiaceae bacterium]